MLKELYTDFIINLELYKFFNDVQFNFLIFPLQYIHSG